MAIADRGLVEARRGVQECAGFLVTGEHAEDFLGEGGVRRSSQKVPPSRGFAIDRSLEQLGDALPVFGPHRNRASV